MSRAGLNEAEEASNAADASPGGDFGRGGGDTEGERRRLREGEEEVPARPGEGDRSPGFVVSFAAGVDGSSGKA